MSCKNKNESDNIDNCSDFEAIGSVRTDRPQKCDIEKVKIVNANLDSLTFQMIEDFLGTFDKSCISNIEYSQWSNEMLYRLFDNEPDLVFKVIEHGQIDNYQILLDEIENPIHDIDFQKIYDRISEIKTKSDFKERVLNSLESASNKEGKRIMR